ncbi:MAG: glycerol-3-phosphate dehydrogenase/oxidase [Pirellulales bacterium]
MTNGSPVVLVLGAGINGCALARELVLAGVPVWLVDRADIASGASAGSSHLIHGGLRYLEYGEFDLVKESLAERGRLLRLAPQFVRPLKLWIPASSRLGGAVGAPGRFFGWKWWPTPVPKRGRGVTLIRTGLALYDAYARDPSVPRHQSYRVPAAGAPAVNRDKYGWLCSYYDAQVAFPERLLMSMLSDARLAAQQAGLDFRVFTYHEAKLMGKMVELSPVLGSGREEIEHTCEPAMIVNATGAWVDETLQRLCVPERRLMGGTKGSHLFTFNARLREMLGADGIYAEASDGRPIFITPLAGTVLIGTTDERFEGPPENAVTTERERDYLLDSVNSILPDAKLTPDDVNFHYSAVRPLPYADARSTSAITRRHAIVHDEAAKVPMISLVGGKLTTMRSLAEQAAAVVFKTLGREPRQNSENLAFTGFDGFPANPDDLPRVCSEIAARVGYSAESVAAVVRLMGIPPDRVWSDPSWGPRHERSLVDDTPLPRVVANWMIDMESVQTLADLVERRLMLLYDQRITYATLHCLADLLPRATDRDAMVSAEAARLKSRYGKIVE